MSEGKKEEYPDPISPEYVRAEKRKSARNGALAGAPIGAVLAAIFMRACNGEGNYDHSKKRDETGEASSSATSGGAYDAGAPKPKDKPGYDGSPNTLQSKLDECNRERGRCEGKLEGCLEDHVELSKRPKNCPSYTQKVCPPAPKCPEIPYIRRGE